MSPNVANSLVHDLVEMAKAMEALPQVQADLDQANRLNGEQGAVIASREESILKLKAQIEALNNRVRDAEVARDDAEMRFLELDEKASAALNLVAGIQRGLEDVSGKLTPPKPEPLPEPEPVNPHVQEPIIEHATGEVIREMPYDYAQGQSESHPIEAVSMAEPSANTVQSITGSAQTGQEIAKPYANKYYYDHPTYVSLNDWLDGGGTEENYYRNAPRDSIASTF